jgi:hypothetical protein
MISYRILLLLKFVGVLLYAGGLVASLVASELAERKRAVHAIASPALLLVWVAGYLLSTQLQVPLTELWLLGGLVLSLVSQTALVYSVSRPLPLMRAAVLAGLPLVLVLILMVFRPTWQTVWP